MVLGNVKNQSLTDILSSDKTIDIRCNTQNKRFFMNHVNIVKKGEGRYTQNEPSLHYDFKYYYEEGEV